MSCQCRCGYRCGGPGTCDLGVTECLRQDDGKHYVKDCDHAFSGPMVTVSVFGMEAQSTACIKCGLPAIQHDMSRGP